MDMKSMFTDTQALDIPLNSNIRIGIPGLWIKQEKVSFEKSYAKKKMSFDRASRTWWNLIIPEISFVSPSEFRISAVAYFVRALEDWNRDSRIKMDLIVLSRKAKEPKNPKKEQDVHVQEKTGSAL